MEHLQSYIHSLGAFSRESWQALLPALTEMGFPKGGYLLRSGEVCNALFYVSKGYCRAFFDKDGQEINTAFFFDNQIQAIWYSTTQQLRYWPLSRH